MKPFSSGNHIFFIQLFNHSRYCNNSLESENVLICLKDCNIIMSSLQCSDTFIVFIVIGIQSSTSNDECLSVLWVSYYIVIRPIVKDEPKLIQ